MRREQRPERARHGLVPVLLALVIGALLVLGALLAYLGSGDHAREAFIKTWGGKTLTLVAGEGRAEDTRLAIERLTARGEAVALVPHVELQASDFAMLRLHVQGLPERLQVSLLWRTAARPGLTHTLILMPREAGVLEARPAGHLHWHGTITDLGILVQDPLRGSAPLSAPFFLEELRLEPSPAGHLAILARLWSEWTRLEAWDGRSINVIFGGPRDSAVPLPPLIAAWAGLAMLLYGAIRRLRREPIELRSLALIFMAGWLVLDIRWQVDLWHRLGLTRQQYAGKDWEARHRAAEDGALFGFIQRVKQALPATPVRVFLISADPRGADRYPRLRAHYHLLPHNVLSDRTLPPQRHIRTGDYVLVLADSTQIRFDAEPQVLRWAPAGSLPVERVLNEGLGDLYKVR